MVSIESGYKGSQLVTSVTLDLFSLGGGGGYLLPLAHRILLPDPHCCGNQSNRNITKVLSLAIWPWLKPIMYIIYEHNYINTCYNRTV